MTCIVGYVDEHENIYLGGDSAGTSGTHLNVLVDKKVFINDGMIYGFTGTYRLGQLLRYSLNRPPQTGTDDHEYMCTIFINKVIECLENNKYAELEDNVITNDGVFLVGYRGVLYKVDSNFQILQLSFNFDACGCGERYALGALYTLRDSNLSPTEKIKIAFGKFNDKLKFLNPVNTDTIDLGSSATYSFTVKYDNAGMQKIRGLIFPYINYSDGSSELYAWPLYINIWVK